MAMHQFFLIISLEQLLRPPVHERIAEYLAQRYRVRHLIMTPEVQVRACERRRESGREGSETERCTKARRNREGGSKKEGGREEKAEKRKILKQVGDEEGEI